MWLAFYYSIRLHGLQMSAENKRQIKRRTQSLQGTDKKYWLGSVLNLSRSAQHKSGGKALTNEATVPLK